MTSKEELVVDVKARDSLVCSDHKMAGFLFYEEEVEQKAGP